MCKDSYRRAEALPQTCADDCRESCLLCHDGTPLSKFSREYPVSCAEMLHLKDVAGTTPGCRLAGDHTVGNLYYDTGSKLTGEVILAYTHTGSHLRVTIVAANALIPRHVIFDKIAALLATLRHENVEDVDVAEAQTSRLANSAAGEPGL